MRRRGGTPRSGSTVATLWRCLKLIQCHGGWHSSMNGAQSRRANSSLLSKRPRRVRTTRPAGPSVTRPMSRPQARVGATAGATASSDPRPLRQPQAEHRLLGDDGLLVQPLAAARRQARGRAIGRPQRGQVAVEPRRVPASLAATVKGVRAGPDGLVRQALPVDQVVPALLAGASEVGQLVPGEAGRGEAVVQPLVHLGGAVGILLGRGGGTPAPRPCARRQVVAKRARQAFGIGVVEGQGVGRHVIRGQGEGRPRASRPRSPGSGPARRTAGRG